MRRSGPLYYFSWLIIIVILLIAVFGSLLKPHGISQADQIEYRKQQIDGKTQYQTPPFRPDSNFLLGSTHLGHDLLSLLLNGLKYTLVIITALTALRIVFAIPWGLWAGMTGKGGRFLRLLHFVTSSAPAFLFVYPPLATMYYGFGLDTASKVDAHSLIIFNVLYFVMLTFFGLIPLAYQVSERAQYYNDKQYVEVSRLMGGSLLHRTLRHIVPNMKLELLFAGLSEFVQVIFLVGQLAVFKIMFGGSERMQWDDGQPERQDAMIVIMHVPQKGEWASMLAYGVEYVRMYPWIIISAASCLFLLILSVQMFINQLKKRFASVNQQSHL